MIQPKKSKKFVFDEEKMAIAKIRFDKGDDIDGIAFQAGCTGTVLRREINRLAWTRKIKRFGRVRPPGRVLNRDDAFFDHEADRMSQANTQSVEEFLKAGGKIKICPASGSPEFVKGEVS